MALHHFIVTYDTDVDQWSIDFDLMLEYFEDGQMWSDEKDSWVSFREMSADEKNLARSLSRSLAVLLQNFRQEI